MSQSIQIITNSKTYNVELLDEEMINISIQISKSKDNITLLNNEISRELTSISSLNSKLLTLYIQKTGQFPP